MRRVTYYLIDGGLLVCLTNESDFLESSQRKVCAQNIQNSLICMIVGWINSDLGIIWRCFRTDRMNFHQNKIILCWVHAEVSENLWFLLY